MARLYSNENIPIGVVEALRALGHDVLTSLEAGNANQRVSDRDVLAYAIANTRIVLTYNRIDFRNLHNTDPDHEGIVTCTPDIDFADQAKRVDAAISSQTNMKGQFLRVNKP